MNERAPDAPNPMLERVLERVEQTRMSSLRIERRRLPDNVNAEQVVVDDSILGPNRTAVTISVRRTAARPQLSDCTAIVEWSHKAGIEHLPAIVGGARVKHINTSPREAGVNPNLAGTH
jgi:hypothetical protein